MPGRKKSENEKRKRQKSDVKRRSVSETWEVGLRNYGRNTRFVLIDVQMLLRLAE